MVAYVRNAGVTNVLWCLNFGATALPPGYADLGAVVRAYYPGDAFVYIVSLDSYPPSAANSSAIAALSATGKPVIYSEMGAVEGPIPVPEYSGDTAAALATLISNFPQVVAAVVWPGTEALPAQNGMAAFMNNPKIINLADLPANSCCIRCLPAPLPIGGVRGTPPCGAALRFVARVPSPQYQLQHIDHACFRRNSCVIECK